MNFEIAAQGSSFKGAMAYYLHDKRQDVSEPRPDTSERVAWTETRNLATDGAHTATRIMIATAKQADELKAAAGIANTGRKATKPVLAFSLAWHPDEAAGLDRAEMTRAADHALKVMGLDHLQAVIIAHRDTAHPHVHVVVNRVNPDNGRMTNIPPQAAKDLNRWAYDYEKSRGNIVSPNRAKAQEESDRRKVANPDADKRKAYIEDMKRRRAQEAEERRKGAVPQNTKPPSEAAILKDLTDAQKARHKAEWPNLSKTYASAKDAIYRDFAGRIKAAQMHHKDATRPIWAEHFRAERDAERTRSKMEKSALGVIALSLEAAKMQMRRGDVPNRGLLSLTFANVLSSQTREAVFKAAQERDRLALANHLKAHLDGQIKTLQAERGEALTKQREVFNVDRAALIERQNAEREKIRAAWRQVYSRARQPQPSQAQVAPRMEFSTVKGEFDQKAQGLPVAPKMETEKRFVSQPAPAPSPMGEVKTPARVVQDVPKVKEVTPAKEVPTAASVWERVAAPPPPAPSTEKATDVWARIADKNPAPREIKPLPTRDKDYDRDR